MRASAHNEALAILDYFGPLRRLIFMTWGFVCGATHGPGLTILARDLAQRRPAAWSRFSAAQRGRLAAWRTRQTVRRVPAALAVEAPVEGKAHGPSAVAAAAHHDVEVENST